MKILKKIDIIPIIIPQICFQDRFGNLNNFEEMNPSLYIEDDGAIKILVRCVNYKKFYNKNFTMYENKSNSIYFILNGKINNNEKLDIENFDYQIIKNNYNLPTFNSYWLGLEDIRFIDSNNLLVIVPELNQNGNPSIFNAKINNNIIENFIDCYPNKIEKNWMPYNTIDGQKVIYSLTPFKIKSIVDNDIEEIEVSEKIKENLIGYHGSTNGISINKFERLFLIHITRDRVYHKWLILNILTNDIKLSEEFTFFKNSYIEFTCSLCKYNDRIFISVGVNDNKAYIIETCENDIKNTFLTNKNNEYNYPTIITMLYDIRSMETKQIERNRKLESYIDFSKKFLLQLPFPLIIFIDENEEVYKSIYNFRKELNLLDKTYIYISDFKQTYFYKDLNRIEELQTKFHILNGEIEHETPLYVILNNNKFDCIDKTIELNPFNSSHLVWIDFGINHVAQNTEIIFEWINKIPDKIKQLCINPFIEKVDYKEHFKLIYHNMAGGLFSGSIENMKIYSKLFKNKTQEIYDNNWYQIDEAVMTMVNRENPDLFELFYGDYAGIISNYEKPLHNIDLILTGSQKYLNHNNISGAYKILQYCYEYFKNNYNSPSIYKYIQQNIITNYYANNRILSNNILELINLNLKSSDISQKESMIVLLKYNINNINYYENKNEILDIINKS
jgi:hypothetical protein